MCSEDQANKIIREMSQNVRSLFPEGPIDVILFGSYARHEETDESDIDVMYLVDAPRSIIAERNWMIGEAAAEVLLKYGLVVSPIVENRDYFNEKTDTLPFFRNIRKEGVPVNA